jgi:hypothetical protein
MTAFFSSAWGKRIGGLLLFAAAAGLALLLAVHIVGGADYHHQDNDFFTFWLAGHLTAQGRSPYNPSAWAAGYRQFAIEVQPNPAFLYPLPLAVLLAPLGLLALRQAYIAWVAASLLLMLGSLLLLLAIQPHGRWRLLVPILVGLVFFRPTVLTLIQGQISALFLFMLVLSVLLWKQGRWFWGGFLLGFFVLKPNLGGPLLLLLVLWLVYRRKFSALPGMLGCALLMLGVGLLVNPGWVGAYLQVGSQKLAATFGASPTVWGLGALACHARETCTLACGGILGLLVLAACAWLVLGRGGESAWTAVGLAVTATLLITPYTWTYDQLLLLLPVTGLSLALVRNGRTALLGNFLFLLLDLLALVLLAPDTLLQVEILNALVPLVILALHFLPGLRLQSLAPG